MKQKNIIYLIIVLIIIIIAGCSFYYYNQNNKTNIPNEIIITETNKPEEITVNLIINYGNEEKAYDDIKMIKGSTAFDLLQKVASDNNIEVGYKDYGGDMGVFVESINNIKNNSEKNLYWQYLVNDNFAMVGASLLELNNGDIIKWNYTASSF